MKILCVHQGAELYGSDRSFALSVNTLREKYRHAEITVVLPKNGKLIELLEPFTDNIKFQDVGTIQRADIRTPFSTVKRLIVSSYRAWKNMKNYDIIYMNTIVVFAYMIAAVFMRKLVINHVREIPGKKEAMVFSLLFRLNRTHLIFNSLYTQQSFSYLNPNRCNVVLNGLKAFESTQSFVSGRTFNILVIGRIHVNKGQLLAVEAVKLLVDKYPNVRLRIVGSPVDGQPWQLEDVLELIKLHDLEKVVEYIPFQSNPQEHFLWSTISLVPSIKPESFGRVAIESLGLGRPVVASNLGGLVEIIQNDVGGYLFNVGDVNDLASKISLFLEDDGLLRKKSIEASRCFDRRFSENIYKKNFSDTFERLLQNI